MSYSRDVEGGVQFPERRGRRGKKGTGDAISLLHRLINDKAAGSLSLGRYRLTYLTSRRHIYSVDYTPREMTISMYGAILVSALTP